MSNKTITLYEQLSEFWTETINKKSNSMEANENKIQVKYNILDTFIANDIFTNEMMYYVEDLNNNHDKNFIHNKYTTCLLFPNYGVRIACTKSFIENIPFVKQILSGNWDSNKAIIKYEYFNQDINETVMGATNIVIEDNTLDSILFEKPYDCKVRDFERKDYFQIRTVTCNNLLELIILKNKLRYETNNFANDTSARPIY